MDTTRKTGLKTQGGNVTTWENGPREAYTGHCATIQIAPATPIGAWGCASRNDALEAMAKQLDALAAEIRALKVAK